MKVKEFIKLLQKLNPEGKVWISDEQGGGGESNPPHAVGRPYKFNSGETTEEDDVMMSYENT